MPQAPVESAVAGAYALLIVLDAPVEFARGGVAGTLPSGCYVYAGSARGPGGIAARLRRHLRKDKKAHWHVDALTLRASRLEALAFPGGCECAIVAALEGSRHFVPALAGFGSSDCRSCAAHLLRVRLDQGSR